MKRSRKLVILILVLGLSCSFMLTSSSQTSRNSSPQLNRKPQPKATPPRKSPTKPAKPATESPATEQATPTPIPISDEEALKEELDVMVVYKPLDRAEKLKAFIANNQKSPLVARAIEMLATTRAQYGDELLKKGDFAAGKEQFVLAIKELPPNFPDRLFNDVISQLPLSLFVRGDRGSALEIAELIETKINDDSRRLLSLAGFYLSIEQANEAIRVADVASKLAPQNPATHQALGAAYHIGLQLDNAAAEYARALEVDPQSVRSRRSLADLKRAMGQPEEALKLYRELLAIDAADRIAQAGAVFSLLDLGRREEAEAEMSNALIDEPRNLALLVGAAYWYAARGDGARSLDLAQRAVAIEPRYTWGQIALARALILQRRPLEAERSLLYARQYGQFPTLDYELATALASIGFYDEAGIELGRAFKHRGGQIETRLAGRVPARSQSFVELLAPERLAAIFQPSSADTETNSRILKGLLAFNSALTVQADPSSVNQEELIAAAQEFTAGDDAMKTYRQLYVATRLLRSGIALPAALEFTDAASAGSDAALEVATAAIAIQVEQLSAVRARAIAQGQTLGMSDVPRSVLSNILRGRIEDVAGWTLFNMDKQEEAILRLRRATGVLPQNTLWWSTAMWHLGAALEASGRGEEALDTYIKSYNKENKDQARRAAIESLYQRLNGSLDGLDKRLAAKTPRATVRDQFLARNEVPQTVGDGVVVSDAKIATPIGTPTPSPEPTPAETPTPMPEVTPEPTPSASPTPVETPSPTPIESPSPSPVESPTSSPTPETVPSPTPEATPTATPVESPSPSIPEPSPTPVETPLPTPATEPSPSPMPEDIRPATRARRVSEGPTPEQPPAIPTPEPSPTPTETIAKNVTPEPTPPVAVAPKPADGNPDCEIRVSEETVTMNNNGGFARIVVTLSNQTRPADVMASTEDWADLSIIAEANTRRERGRVTFRITSVNIRPGNYRVKFKSPCGTREVVVVVK